MALIQLNKKNMIDRRNSLIEYNTKTVFIYVKKECTFQKMRVSSWCND